jgi:hypothetical protein
VIPPRSATLTLVLLALAPGCSSQSSAPGPAHGAAEDKSASELRKDIAGEAAPQRAAEPADASPPTPAPESSAAADAAAAKTAEERALSRVQIGEPMINGGLDRDIIRRKAQDHEAELQACLGSDPTLAGKLAVKLSVDARGVVKDVELGEGSELDDRELVDCILEHVATWSFAGEATAAATVELNLELTPAN